MRPGRTRRAFIVEQFAPRITWRVLLTSLAVALAIPTAVVVAMSIVRGQPPADLLDLSPERLLFALPAILFSGPFGEELGWCAYLQREAERTRSVAYAGVLVGLAWGFWHWPLWLVSGYEGLQLLQYIATFLVAIVPLSVVTAVLYRRCRNLAIPILLHFLFNYSVSLVAVDLLESLPLFALGYAVAAVLLVASDPASRRRPDAGLTPTGSLRLPRADTPVDQVRTLRTEQLVRTGERARTEEPARGRQR